MLHKLQQLCLYLRVTNRSDTVLAPGAAALLILASEVKRGGGRIGLCPGARRLATCSDLPAETPTGLAVWNRLRASKWATSLPTDGEHGGPGPVHLLLSRGALSPAQVEDARRLGEEQRSAYEERYFQQRRRFMAPPPDYAEDTTTLPLYRSQEAVRTRLSQLEIGLQSIIDSHDDAPSILPAH